MLHNDIDDLRDMMEFGQRKAKSHMLVILDRAEDDEEILFARGNGDLRTQVASLQSQDTVSILEVYNLSHDIEDQLGRHCVYTD